MKKAHWLFLALAFVLVLEACYTPPKVRPAMSQTVISVQRYPAKKAADAKAVMEIYIDNVLQGSVPDNQSIPIPVNDGVHSIHVKVGKTESDALNFTAAQKTVSFLASVESTGALFWKKTKLVLARSSIDDDTGSMANKPTQEHFTPQ